MVNHGPAKAPSKAERLLADGGVAEISGARAFAVEGDHEYYLVTLIEGGAAYCTCRATLECSHVAAARALVARDGSVQAA